MEHFKTDSQTSSVGLTRRDALRGFAALAAVDAAGAFVLDSKAGVAEELKLLDEGVLSGRSLEADVVGRAAAAIFIAGGVRSVRSRVMSDGAAELFAAAGVEAECEERVPYILNRRRTGMCPMESAVKDLRDVGRMVSVLRGRVAS